MNKKVLILIVLVAVLAVSLAACNNSKTYKQDAVSGFDASAAVVSNGGLAVRQGNHLYYVNAYEGASAENTFGAQTKTCLMRATVADDGTLTDKIVMVPKNIYSGSATSGIYIYNGWIYYATPNVDKDKSGTINTVYLDFYRTSLDRTQTELLYTIDNRAANFRFTKDSILVLDDNKIFRVDLNKKNAKKIFVDENYVSVAERISSITAIAADNAFGDYTFAIQTAPDEENTFGYNTLGVVDAAGCFKAVISKDTYAGKYTIAVSDYVVEGDSLTLYYTKTATGGDGVSRAELCCYKFTSTDFAFDKANEKSLLTNYSGSAVKGVSYADGAIVTLSAAPFVYKVNGTGAGVPVSTESNPDAAITVRYIAGGYMYYTASSSATALYRFALSYEGASDTRVAEKVCDISISTAWVAPEFLGGYMYYLDGKSSYAYRVKLDKSQEVELVGVMTEADAETYLSEEE